MSHFIKIENPERDAAPKYNHHKTSIKQLQSAENTFIRSPNFYKNILDEILKVNLENNSILKNVDKRLHKLGDVTTVAGQPNGEALECLPIGSIEELNVFEMQLNDQECRDSFKHYISKIGGIAVKDSVSRCLKATYSNEMAVFCSWLGQRGNHRVCDITSMKIIKNHIMNSFPDSTMLEIDTYGSEWFRLSKLRLSRKEK